MSVPEYVVLAVYTDGERLRCEFKSFEATSGFAEEEEEARLKAEAHYERLLKGAEDKPLQQAAVFKVMRKITMVRIPALVPFKGWLSDIG